MALKDDLTASLERHTGLGADQVVRLADKVHADITPNLYTEIVEQTQEMVDGLLTLMLMSAAQNGASAKVLDGLNGIVDVAAKAFTEESK